MFARSSWEGEEDTRFNTGVDDDDNDDDGDDGIDDDDDDADDDTHPVMSSSVNNTRMEINIDSEYSPNEIALRNKPSSSTCREYFEWVDVAIFFVGQSFAIFF